MLRIRALTLEDFAPFKGVQRVTFADAPGVTVISANNGIGKTWLLNAIRYALFGHVLGRTDIQQDLSHVPNWLTARETGRRVFRVVLDLDADGVAYRLTRSYDAGRRPAEEVLLARESSVLNQEETGRVLQRLMPEQIARFFLFDGELLRQYEELAKDPTRGEDLKNAIERILGLPILVNARVDVLATGARITRAVAQAAAADVQTRQLGTQLKVAQDLLDEATRSFDELKNEVEQLEHEVARLEQEMARTQRAQKLFARRDALRDLRTKAVADRDAATAELKVRIAGIWREMLSADVGRLVAECDARIAELTRTQRAEVLRLQRIADRREAAEIGVCPTCGKPVDAHSLPEPDVDSQDVNFDRLSQDLESILRQKSQLQALGRGDEGGIGTVEARVEELRVAVADLDAQIDEITDSLEDAPEAEIKRVALDYANNNSTLARARSSRDAAEGRQKDQQKAVHQLMERLANLATSDKDRLQAKHAVIGRLGDLFESGVDHYRRLLSERVEEEATRVFRLLRSQEEYEGLKINEGYGLTIMHRDGEPIPVRSAGYEHLVALSLLAALQRCAPIKGPVILDSQFGRLDSNHKMRLVSSLPAFADQVILLAYDDEFDRDAAASSLGPRLVAEKRLRQLNARHTVIEDRFS